MVSPDERAAQAEKKRFETAFNQGLGLMLISLVVAIILTLLQDAHLIPQIYVKIIAAFFVLAGLTRMLYPYLVAKGPALSGFAASSRVHALINSKKQFKPLLNLF